MTIKRTLRKRLRRYALFCLMAATSAAGAVGAMADDPHDCTPCHDPDMCGWIAELAESTSAPDSIIHQDRSAKVSTPQFLTVKITNELAIDTCNYSEWLVATVGTPLPETVTISEPAPEQSSVDKVASRTSSEFNVALATIAAAASAGNPIPFSHWTEPFAMIDPNGGHSSQQICSFQAWFDQGQEFVNRFRLDHPGDFVPVVDFSGEIITPAADSPASDMTAEDEGIVLVETTPTVDANDALVGGSAFIMTIDDVYLSYDLADRDRVADAELASSVPDAPSETDDQPQLVWVDGLFSPPRQPFCIHSLSIMREPGWSPLACSTQASPTEQAASTEQAAPLVEVEGAEQESIAVVYGPENRPESFAETIAETITTQEPVLEDAEPSIAESKSVLSPTLLGSADCLLDELVWQVSVALEDESVTKEWLRPQRIGYQVASLVVSGDRLATRIAIQLASVWPADARPAKLIPGIGARLLARAEAVGRLEEDRLEPVRLDAEPLLVEGSTDPITQQQLAQANAMLLQWVDVAQRVIDDYSNRLNAAPEVARNRGTQDSPIRR